MKTHAPTHPTTSLPPETRSEIEATFGMIPTFARVMPSEQTQLWWATMRDFQLADTTALSNKTKELIGVAVASQIPCRYCARFHTEAARLNGATDKEIQEAIFMAGLKRQGSAILNGVGLDAEVFDEELQQIVSHIKRQSAQPSRSKVPASR